jgi:hypothetical protein
MDQLAERVAALSTAKLALLNLRLHELVTAPGTHAGAPAAVTGKVIPRLTRQDEADATALERLEEMSDAEVDALLERMLEPADPPPAPRADAAPDVIPRVARDREAQLLAGLENLSDDDVDSLLNDLMSDPLAGDE